MSRHALTDDTGLAGLPWAAAMELLRRPGRILLACHIAPDGDALGSMLAVGLGLRALGADVVASFSEPFGVPASLRFLPGQDLLVPPARAPERPDVLVTFDTASPERLGGLTDRVDTAGAVVVVDHHATNPGFGAVNLIEPDLPATVVLADELLTRLGVPLDAELATCLYTGLTSDTGSFRFAGTTARTHQLAARLLDTGIAHDEIARALFDTHPFGWLGLVGDVGGRAVLEPDGARGHGLVWSYATVDDYGRRDLAFEETESLIDIVRMAAEAEVAMVAKQVAEHPGGGRWSLSLRSKGAVDVAAACASLGGGGHRMAAGLTFDGRLDEAIHAVREALETTGAGSGR